MLPYSVIMFAIAALLFVFAVLIYRGNTRLIHDYHRKRVKDEAAYGRAFGKALACFSIPLIAAGIVGLFTASFLPTAVLLIGIALASIPLIRVQKKYNGGVF